MDTANRIADFINDALPYAVIGMLVLFFLQGCIYLIVGKNEIGVICRRGKFLPERQPGKGSFIIPFVDKATAVYVGKQSYSLDEQGAKTSDGQSLTFDVDVQYCVANATTSVQNPISDQLQTIVTDALTHAISQLTLISIVDAEVNDADAILDELNNRVSAYGIEFVQVETFIDELQTLQNCAHIARTLNPDMIPAATTPQLAAA